MLKKAIALFCFLFFLIQLNAQTLPFEKYTSKNGLVSDRITAIAQDDKGFMWFGSYFGISMYDGVQFKKANLPIQQQNKYVTSLLSANKKIYAGFLFGGGLAEFENGQTRSYFIKGKDSVAANDFVCMYDNGDGSILLGNTAGQLYSFKNGSFSFLYNLPINAGLYPHSIQKDKFNSIWVGSEQGLYVLPQPYRKVFHLFPKDNVFSLTKSKNEIWLARTNGVSTTIQSASGLDIDKIVDLKTQNQLTQIKPSGFYGNRQWGLWLININKGLVNINNGQIRQFNVSIDPTTDINSVFADREGNIWIANEPGVMKISNFTAQAYLFDETAIGSGSLTIGNDSLIWVSNSKALYSITNKGIEKKNLSNAMNRYYGLLHADQNRNLWIGYWDEGLVKARWEKNKLLSADNKTVFKQTKIKAQAVAEDSKGNIWIAGSNGLYHIKEKRVVDFVQPKNILGQPAFITCMSLDEENKILWLGDNANGVIKLKMEEGPNGLYKYRELDFITSRHGLKDTYIRSILADKKNHLWIGTRFGGIYKVENRNKQNAVTHLNKEANLSCNRISDIVMQDTTAVWFASCDGLYNYQYATNAWAHLNTSDGLLNAEIFSLEYDEKRQSIWALSAQGVTRLNTHTEKIETKPLVSITSVTIPGKSEPLALISKSPVRFSSGNNSIRIDFAGASFIDEKKITYKYILEGHDKVCSDQTFTNNVTYASLPPGKYHFKVMTANARGIWSGEVAGFEFEIVMPFYKRTWFVILCIAFIFLMAYFIRLQQLKQRFKIEKLRLSIAKDLHDDVGATLGSITILSKTATRKLDKKHATEEVLPIFDKISQSAKDTLDAMDDIVWSINPDKDSFHDLTIRMREFAIPLLEAKEITFSFETVGSNDKVIPMDLRRNAFLIFKESIHNVLKHANAAHVNIKILATDTFAIEIKDDGNGFEISSPTQRNGLRNMQSRAKEVKGRVEVVSSKDGTSIQFKAPLR